MEPGARAAIVLLILVQVGQAITVPVLLVQEALLPAKVTIVLLQDPNGALAEIIVAHTERQILTGKMLRQPVITVVIL